MNDGLRIKLQAVKAKLDDIRGEIGVCLGEVQNILNVEEESYDNMADNLKGSERGQKLEASKDALQEAADTLEEIDDKLSDIDSNIDTAME